MLLLQHYIGNGYVLNTAYAVGIMFFFLKYFNLQKIFLVVE